jgi:quinol monooxygenase YgiN
MSELTLVAKITALEGSELLVKTELLKVVGPTQKESGCITYTLHQDNANPLVFIMFERWESPAHLKAHMQTDHFINCMAATKEGVKETTFNQLTMLS